jgi:hypothetical protein
VLVDRRDANFVPARLLERLQDREAGGGLWRSRVRARIVACIFVDQQTAIRMNRLLKRGFNAVCIVGYIVVIAGDEQRRYVDCAKPLRVPCLIRRLFAPRRWL